MTKGKDGTARVVCPACNRVVGSRLSDLHRHFLEEHEAPNETGLFHGMLRNDYGVENMAALFRDY
jgi:hypothetical protein